MSANVPRVYIGVGLDTARYGHCVSFLRGLDLPKTISIGEPKRNQDYKNAHYPKRKADPIDSLACARFAIVERPAATPATPAAFAQLRNLASALAGQRKTTTRHINRLHNHLARVFPELAVLAPNLAADWVLTLLTRYPTPARIAAARLQSLVRIPYADAARVAAVQAAAGSTTGTLQGPLAEALVRELVAMVRQSQQAEQRLFGLLEQAYDELPAGGPRQLESIPGIGKRTGVDKRGNPVPKGTMQMSRKGNDLVRGLLWMAAQSALQCNPAIRALYLRQRAAGKRGDVALGHGMRKLLHLVFAVWKTNRPFDPAHHPWPSTTAPPALATEAGEPAAQRSAAGRKGHSPKRKAVTAAAIQLATRSVPPAPATAKMEIPARVAGAGPHQINFAQLRRQVRMTDVLERLGLLDRLTGRGAQRRGPCPIHQPDRARGRCFSVNLDKQVFRCLAPDCAAHGNVLDLWAAVHRLPLRAAAWHLATTLNLIHHCQPQPTTDPETLT